MKYHHQLIMHQPEQKTFGDCMRAAIACLLDKRPEEVPHFLWDGCDGAEFSHRIDAYLATQDLSLVRIAFMANTVQEIVNVVSANNPDTRFLVSGKTSRGTSHVIIACNGETEHDTHPTGAGLSAPYDDGQVIVEFLVPRAVHRKERS